MASPENAVGQDGCDRSEDSRGGWRSLFAVPQTALVPSLGVNYVAASKPEVKLELPLHRRSLSLAQKLDEHGISGVVWDCGRATAALLDACPSLVAQRRVIDIGCGGCGVAGLAAAVCGAASCVLTDFEDLRPMVEENIRNNFGAKSSSAHGAIRFEAYAWESSSSTHSLAPSYETVLCADCMYDSAMVEPLIKAIDAVSGPETLLVLSYKRRVDERERHFFERMSDRWDLDIVPRARFAREPRRDDDAAPRSLLSERSALASQSEEARYFPDVHVLIATPKRAAAMSSGATTPSCWLRVLRTQEEEEGAADGTSAWSGFADHVESLGTPMTGKGEEADFEKMLEAALAKESSKGGGEQLRRRCES